MFKAFFSGLSRLVANVQALADTFGEANERLREQLHLDGPADLSTQARQLPAPEENGRSRKVKATS